MAQKEVVWTETAAQQRRSILEYWLQRNQSSTYSLKLLRLSNAKAIKIADNPLIYKKVEFPIHALPLWGISVCFIKQQRAPLLLQHSGITGKTQKSF